MNLLTLTMATIVSTSATAASNTIDLDFEGGTVQEWVTAIKAESPKSNIVVSAHVAGSYVSAMDLHDVSVSSLMMLCNVSGDSPITSDVIHEGGEPIWIISESQRTMQRGQNRGPSQQSSLSTIVLNVPRPYADQGSSVADMIREVCGMSSDQPVEIRVIKTGIIALHGSYDQQAIAEDVLSALAQEISVKPQNTTAGATRQSENTQALRKGISDAARARRESGGTESREDFAEAMEALKSDREKQKP